MRNAFVDHANMKNGKFKEFERSQDWKTYVTFNTTLSSRVSKPL